MFNIPIRKASGPKKFELAIVKDSLGKNNLASLVSVVFVAEDNFYGCKEYFKVIPLANEKGYSWSSMRSESKVMIVNKNSLDLITGHYDENLRYKLLSESPRTNRLMHEGKYNNLIHYNIDNLDEISIRIQELTEYQPA